MSKEILAKEYDYIPNPDFMKRTQIKEDIKLNDGYCISKPQSEDTKCICTEFREQNHCGVCNCGLYYKVLRSPKVCLCGSTKFKDKFF